MARVVAVVCALVLTLLCLVHDSEQRGRLEVNHVFSSAGEVVTAERLSSASAQVGTVEADRVNFSAFDELVIESRGLDLDGSYTHIVADQSLSIETSETIDVDAGHSLYMLSSMIEVSAAQELNIISPRAHTSLIGVHGTVEAGGVELSSGLQGTTVSSSGGSIALGSEGGSVRFSGGGVADISALTELEVLANTGDVVILSTSDQGTAGLYAQERAAVDAFRNLILTATDPDDGRIVARAGNVLDLASGGTVAASFQESITIASNSDTVHFEAAQSASVISFTTLTLLGGEEGTQVVSAGIDEGTLSVSSSIADVTVNGDAGAIVHADVNVDIDVSTGAFDITSGNLLLDGGEVLVGSSSSPLSDAEFNFGLSSEWIAHENIDIDASGDIDVTLALIGRFRTGDLGKLHMYGASLAKASANIVHVQGGQVDGTADFFSVNSGNELRILNERGEGLGGGDILIGTESGKMDITSIVGTFNVIGGDAVFSAAEDVSFSALQAVVASANLDSESSIEISAGELEFSGAAGGGGGVLFTNEDTFQLYIADTYTVDGAAISATSTDGGNVEIGAFDLLTVSSPTVTVTADDVIGEVHHMTVTGANSIEFNSIGKSIDISLHFGEGITATSATVEWDSTTSGAFSTYANAHHDDALTVTASGAVGTGVTFSGSESVFSSHGDVTLTSVEDTTFTVQGSLNFDTGYQHTTATVAGEFQSNFNSFDANGENIHFAAADEFTLEACQGCAVSSITISSDVRGFRTLSSGVTRFDGGLGLTVSTADNAFGSYGGAGVLTSDVLIDLTGDELLSVISDNSVAFNSGGTLEMNSRRDIYVSAAEEEGDTVSFAAGSDWTMDAEIELLGSVSDGRMSVTSDGPVQVLSTVGDGLFSATTHSVLSRDILVESDLGNWEAYGGSISMASHARSITVDAGRDIFVRSNAAVNHHLLTEGVTDEIYMESKQHWIADAADTATIQGSGVLIETHRFGVDDDFDGDFLFLADDIVVSTARSHSNDIRLTSGGNVTMNAGLPSDMVGGSDFEFDFSNDATIQADEQVIFRGHDDGSFAALSIGGGDTVLFADDGKVIVHYDGKDFSIESTKSSFRGGSDILVSAHDEIDFRSDTHLYFLAEGHRPNQHAFDADVAQRDAGMIVTTSDTSGNIAIDSRHAHVRVTGGLSSGADEDHVRVSSEEIVTLSAFQGVHFDTEKTVIVESQDGFVQIQGSLGLSVASRGDQYWEASRLLSIETEDSLQAAAEDEIEFRAESGDIFVGTEFFKDIVMNAGEDIAINGGGSGVLILSEDDLTFTAAKTADFRGHRGVTLSTLGGPISFVSPDIDITATLEIDVDAGLHFQAFGGAMVWDSDNLIEVETLGGHIHFEATGDLSIDAADSLTVLSGVGSSPRNNADRTLVQGGDVDVTSPTMVMDATDVVRFGFETSPDTLLQAATSIEAFTTGNIFADLDDALAVSAADLRVFGGREGAEFTSASTLDVTSTTGAVNVLVPNALLDIKGVTDVTMTAKDFSVVGGGLIHLESRSTDAVTPGVEVISSTGTLDSVFAAPEIEVAGTTELIMDAALNYAVSAQDAIIINAPTSFALGGAIVDTVFTAVGRQSFRTTDPGSDITFTAETFVDVQASGVLNVLASGSLDFQYDDVTLTDNLRGISVNTAINAPGHTGEINFDLEQLIELKALKSFIVLDSLGDFSINADQDITYTAFDIETFARDDITLLAQNGPFKATADGNIDLTAGLSMDFTSKTDMTLKSGGALGVSGASVTIGAGDAVVFQASLGTLFKDPDTGAESTKAIWIHSDATQVGDVTFTSPEDLSFITTTTLLSAGEYGSEGTLDITSATDDVTITLAPGNLFFSTFDRGLTSGVSHQQQGEPFLKLDSGDLIEFSSTTDHELTSGTATFTGRDKVFLDAEQGVTVTAERGSVIALASNAMKVAAADTIHLVAEGPIGDVTQGVPGVLVQSESNIDATAGSIRLLAQAELDINALRSITIDTALATFSSYSDISGDVLFNALPGAGEDITVTGTASLELTAESHVSSTSSTALLGAAGVTLDGGDLVEVSAHGGSDEAIVITGANVLFDANGLLELRASDGVDIHNEPDNGNQLTITATNRLSLYGEEFVIIDGEQVNIDTEDLLLRAGESINLFMNGALRVDSAAGASLYRAGVESEKATIQLFSEIDLRVDGAATRVQSHNDIRSRSQTWAIAGAGIELSASNGDVSLVATGPGSGEDIVFTGSSFTTLSENFSTRQHNTMIFHDCGVAGVVQQQAATTGGPNGLFPTGCACNAECQCPTQQHMAIDLFVGLRNIGLLQPNIR